MQPRMSADGPYFPEFDLTREERLRAIAKILLDALREVHAERNREKTRRCRARKKAAAATTPALDIQGEQSRHRGEEDSLAPTVAPDSAAHASAPATKDN